MAYADPEVRRAKSREAMRRYRERHADRLKQERKAAYYADHEAALEYQRNYRAANREASREAVRRSYQRHADKRRADALAYKYSVEQSCAVGGCDTRATTNAEGSMCDKHIWRLKQWGTADDSGAMDRSGENCPHWGGDDIDYKSAHQRVYRARGKASEYLCVDCDGPAVDWSYNHQDPNERAGLSQNGKYVLRYSTDPQFYDARCKSCHIKYDANRELTHA